MGDLELSQLRSGARQGLILDFSMSHVFNTVKLSFLGAGVEMSQPDLAAPSLLDNCVYKSTVVRQDNCPRSFGTQYSGRAGTPVSPCRCSDPAPD
eukprot:290928-Hanusia_phi.AAC.1